MGTRCSRTTRPVALLALAAVAACGSGGGDATTPTNESITIALSAPTLAVVQGQGGTVSITLTRGGGYTGAVSLALENAPAGVGGSFSPPSLSGTTTSSTLTINAASTAAAATSNLTVRASGSGVTSHSMPLGLTVTAAPTGGYTLSLSSSTLNLAQGASGNVTVNVNRTAPFAGAVSVAATGLPTNVTMSPNPANVTGANAQLTFAVAANVPAGSYPITLRGTATGAADQQVTLTLQVAGTSGGTSVTVSYCQADPPIWVGSQSETGPWIRATSTAANTYTFNISNRGGYAAVYNASGGGFRIEVTYGTATELAAGGVQCTVATGNKLVSGTVASLAATDSAYVSLGGAEGGRKGPGAFQLFDVGEGPLDLMAVRFATTFTSSTPTKMILRRGVNQASGSPIPVLDFAAAEAFDPVTATMTFSNLGSDFPILVQYLATASGGTGAYYVGGLFGADAAQPWYGAPESKLAAGDLHSAIAYGVNQPGDQFRAVYLWARQITNRTVTLGPGLSVPTLSVVATSPYVRHRVQFTRQAEYAQAASVEFDQNGNLGGANYRTVSIQATAAYFGGNPTTWDVTMPDLSGASGFLATWGPQSSFATEYFVGAFGGPGDINASPSDGLTLSLALRAGNAPSAGAALVAGDSRLGTRRAIRAWPRLRGR